MPNSSDDLRARIEACRARLTAEALDPAALDPKERAELLQLLSDLDARLAPQPIATSSVAAVVATGKSPTEKSPTDRSPIERLRDYEQSVEAAHPVLCGLIGNLADSLSRIGV